MKNFPIKVQEDTIINGENMKGKTFWVSRSCAVAVFVFANIKGIWYVLANQRGKGCPDYQGYWNCPCGYVDYNETIREAAYRELWEESMLNKSDVKLRQVGFNDNPNDNKQNITFRLVGLIDTNSLPEIYCEFSEPDEIENLAWIPLAEIGIYNWAFNHDKLIIEFPKFVGFINSKFRIVCYYTKDYYTPVTVVIRQLTFEELWAGHVEIAVPNAYAIKSKGAYIYSQYVHVSSYPKCIWSCNAHDGNYLPNSCAFRR